MNSSHFSMVKKKIGVITINTGSQISRNLWVPELFPPFVCIYHIFFIHLSVSGHLGCFYWSLSVWRTRVGSPGRAWHIVGIISLSELSRYFPGTWAQKVREATTTLRRKPGKFKAKSGWEQLSSWSHCLHSALQSLLPMAANAKITMSIHFQTFNGSLMSSGYSSSFWWWSTKASCQPHPISILIS